MIDALTIVLYVLGSILLALLIVLVVKLIITIDKVNKIADDVSEKLKSLNSFFSIIDFTTDKLSMITDKFVELVTSLMKRIFMKKGMEENENE